MSAGEEALHGLEFAVGCQRDVLNSLKGCFVDRDFDVKIRELYTFFNLVSQ